MSRRLIFLPGVGGDATFWRPVGDKLPVEWDKVYLGWPGLGLNPPDPAVNSYAGLIALTEAQLRDGPVDLVAHSMGGVIALNVALRHPEKVRRLVLCVTSGGVDVAALGATDWRDDYRKAFPDVAEWVTVERPGFASGTLETISQPVLLIWGDADPISPLAVGEHLADLLAQARMIIVKGGAHDLALSHTDTVASAIREHLL